MQVLKVSILESLLSSTSRVREIKDFGFFTVSRYSSKTAVSLKLKEFKISIKKVKKIIQEKLSYFLMDAIALSAPDLT